MMALPCGRKRCARRDNPSRDPFERLLALLDPDRDAAGRRYEDIRWTLKAFFTRRGAPFADEMADETMDRVGWRLAAGARIHAEDPALYFYGVARNVLRESWAQRARRLSTGAAGLEWLLTDVPPEPEEDVQERRLECLQRCLDALPPAQRRMVLDYYQPSGHPTQARRALAATLGVRTPALHVRMHRLRLRLGECTRRCLAGADLEPAQAPGAGPPCRQARG